MGEKLTFCKIYAGLTDIDVILVRLYLTYVIEKIINKHLDNLSFLEKHDDRALAFQQSCRLAFLDQVGKIEPVSKVTITEAMVHEVADDYDFSVFPIG